MPVRIARKYEYQGSVTLSSLNTETALIDLGDFSDTIILEGYVDLREFAEGDTVEIRVYIAVDGTNRVKYDSLKFNGPVDPPVVHLTAMTLPKNAKPKVTVTQTAGTLRTVYYYFVVEEMEEI